jgi:hypothetical protein
MWQLILEQNHKSRDKIFKKINWSTSTLKTFMHQFTLKRQKIQAQNGGKIANYIYGKGLIPKIYKELL